MSRREENQNKKYDIGDVAHLRCVFTNPRTRQNVDPSLVSCRILPPDGRPVFTAPVTREGVGIYEARVVLDASGNWEYRFEATGDNPAAAEGILGVRISSFG